MRRHLGPTAHAASSDPGTVDPGRSDPGRSAPSRSALLEREEQAVEAEPGDHERFAHYVQKSKITESAVTGKPVIALCGKVWVPGRDPSKFPVCPQCKAIYDKLRPGPGDKGKGKGK